MMASQGGGSNVLRDYRKGNWTVDETMILIEAKKMDDERRMKSERGKPTEQRWKWVEDYCWRKSCFRSQSQCNDKWDNLMRDFKKVREYERKLVGNDDVHHHDQRLVLLSYWKMEKNQRKEKNLPSNMLFQIYEALVEVVERRGVQRVSIGGGGGAGSSGGGGATSSGGGGERPFFVGQPNLLPPIMQHSTQNPTQLSLPPQQTIAQPTTTSNVPCSQPLPTLDSDTSEHSDSSAKRRRRGEGTSGDNNTNEVVNAISKSATIMAEAMQAHEDREERRHRELLSLHEKRLQIEESKAEITRQAINGMVDAINKLANSILALASNKNQK